MDIERLIEPGNRIDSERRTRPGNIMDIENLIEPGNPMDVEVPVGPSLGETAGENQFVWLQPADPSMDDDSGYCWY